MNEQQKQQQLREFFSIRHTLDVNLRLLPEHFVLPEVEDLVEHMPMAFRIASEVSDIDTQALRPLRNLGDHASDLVTYLNHLSRKIDLMMSLVLQQHDDESERFQSLEFGGGGLILLYPRALEPGNRVELKIFLPDEAAAVFCYAEVIECKPDDQQSFKLSLLYTHIREQDQELLVRASLHLQTKQLKKNRTNKHQ